jgi:hypothetical protein
MRLQIASSEGLGKHAARDLADSPSVWNLSTRFRETVAPLDMVGSHACRPDCQTRAARGRPWRGGTQWKHAMDRRAAGLYPAPWCAAQ